MAKMVEMVEKKTIPRPDSLSRQETTGKQSAFIRPLRIAMIGQKGLPATYGGVEQHVEDLSLRLVRMGHGVTVFCRSYYSGNLDNHPDISRDETGRYSYKNIDIRVSRSINTKHLDTITHSAISAAMANRRDFDIVHFHGIGPSFMSFMSIMGHQKCVATIHALDYRQNKWGPFARACLRIGLKSALSFPDTTICVSRTMRQTLGNPSNTIYIPNGAKEPCKWGKNELGWMSDNGLDPNSYILFVGRLIEDKGCHHLCRAVRELGGGLKLAVAGSSSFTDDYVKGLKRLAGRETVFLGSVYASKLSALYQNCALFVLPSSVEGLPIVMLEAMKHGAPVLSSDIPENMEILEGEKNRREVGISFKEGDIESLKTSIQFALSHPEYLNEIACKAESYVDDAYSLDRVAEMTNSVYQRLFPENKRIHTRIEQGI